MLSRLRIGHTRLTHQFILEGGSAPVCDRCDVVLSVEHILVHCSRYIDQRQRFHLDGKCLAAILDDGADIHALVGFLKCIKLFYEF